LLDYPFDLDPILESLYLVMRHNQHELPAYHGSQPRRLIARRYLYDEPCFYPYRPMTINPDGAVAPCCAISHMRLDFGSIHQHSVRKIWNSLAYRSARSLFSDRPVADPVQTVCDGCLLYKQRGHRVAEERAGR
jgi:radical SAM protein with 4Fe4S-binding SPASM domain